MPLLTCSHPRAPIADGGEAFLGQQPVHGQIAHRERVRVSGKARLERLQGDMVRCRRELAFGEGVEICGRDHAIRDERTIGERLGHSFRNPPHADHARVPADRVLPEVYEFVCRELDSLGVGGPGIGSGRGWGRPRQIRGDDPETIANGQAAIRLRVIGDQDLNGRSLPTRSSRKGVEIGTRVLHALMQERDVLRVHAGIDAERDPNGVRRSRRRQLRMSISSSR